MNLLFIYEPMEIIKTTYLAAISFPEARLSLEGHPLIQICIQPHVRRHHWATIITETIKSFKKVFVEKTEHT